MESVLTSIEICYYILVNVVGGIYHPLFLRYENNRHSQLGGASIMTTKRTFQPKKRHKERVHGFMKRMNYLHRPLMLQWFFYYPQLIK